MVHAIAFILKGVIVSQFESKTSGGKDLFIKHDSDMLQMIYGTEKVTPYWVADMEFSVANPITSELQRLVDRGVYSYEFNSKGVFNALVNWYQQRHNLTLNAGSFVQVPGVLSGLASALEGVYGTRRWCDDSDASLSPV